MKKLAAALIVLASLVVFSATASAKDIVDHTPFTEILKKHVNSKGMVDYKGLKANKEDFSKLESYLKSVADAKVSGSQNAQLAFYLNAYNAIVLHSIIENLPTKSVMKIDGFFKKDAHPVAGKKVTLDHLEHKIIRPTFKDARIHFALVCAAVSCPPLKQKAFTEKNVQKFLEANTKAFVPKATKVDTKAKTVTTSKLFEWFTEDFVADEGSVHAYLAKYIPKHAEALKSGDLKIKYSHYDWALNTQ